MKIGNVTRLLRKAREKERDKLLMWRWMLHYQSQMPFDEFKSQIIPEISTRPTEDILKEVYEIREKITKREGEMNGDI